MNVFLEAARDYLALGLHPIPCAPRSKRPMVEWRRYQDEAPLPDELETWWSVCPDANVALVMGRGMFAVDLDGGPEAERLLFDRGILLPGAPRSQTANGFHILLAAPGPVPDRVGLLTTRGSKPQVDIRGVGIIVAPPSIHPTGAVYEWRVPLALPFPPAPPELLRLIAQGTPDKSPSSRVGGSWVIEALHGVGEGLRDATCTRLAGYFLGLGVDTATVEAILLESFARNCTPPLDRASVLKCVRSIERKEAMAGTRDRGGLQPLRIDAVLEALLEAVKHPPRPIRSPFARLNQWLDGGFQPGNLIYLGARPGVGKTAMALQIARAVGLDGERVLVISREMVLIALGRRLLAQTSRVSASRLRRWELTIEDQADVEVALRQLRGLPIWLTDQVISVGELATMATDHGPWGLIIVDYLQLVRAPTEIRERRLQVEAVSQQLKTLAMTCGVPVLCLSSLARPGREHEGRRPGLSDLRESGELEHDADLVIFLHRAMLEAEAEVIIAKNRDGAVGIVGMRFTPEILTFAEESP